MSKNDAILAVASRHHPVESVTQQLEVKAVAPWIWILIVAGFFLLVVGGRYGVVAT